MSVAREPLETWDPFRPRLSLGWTFAISYWLGASLLAARAYELGFHRYLPRDGGAGGGNEMLLTLARDAGLWGASATAATAFGLFLGLLALRRLSERLARG